MHTRQEGCSANDRQQGNDPQKGSDRLQGPDRLLYFQMLDPTLGRERGRSALQAERLREARRRTNPGGGTREFETVLKWLAAGVIALMLWSWIRSLQTAEQATVVERPKPLVTLGEPSAAFWQSMKPATPLPKGRRAAGAGAGADSGQTQLDNDFLIQNPDSSGELQQTTDEEMAKH